MVVASGELTFTAPVIYIRNVLVFALDQGEKTCKSLFLGFKKLNQSAAKPLAVYGVPVSC